MNTGLRRFAKREQIQEPERCEMCREVLDDRHGHVVDLEQRSLACACRACYLLFTHEGAAGGRYKSVPDRYRHDPLRPLTDADWDDLGIPVSTAFFFTSSAVDRVLAYYPGPAGATESLLDLDGWDRVAAEHPLLTAARPDVEAIFVSGREAFLVPIDACYRLVGTLRMAWHGFDGGQEVREALATFLATARERSRPIADSELGRPFAGSEPGRPNAGPQPSRPISRGA